MTENESIKLMKSLVIDPKCELVKTLDFKATVIKALEEVQQYRAIGTIEKFKALKEKAEPKKPTNINEEYGTFDCPTCGHTLIAIDDMTIHQNCLLCGQKLDWQ